MRREEKKLVQNTLLLMLGNFSSKLLVFFMVPLYTSVLSTEEYATSDLLTTTINLAYPFATLMISTAVMRFCLDHYNDVKQLLSIGFWIEILGILLVSIGSFFFFNAENLVKYRVFFLTGFAGYSFFTLFMEYAKGSGKVTLYSLSGLCNTIALILSNLLFLLKLGLGIEGYLLAMIAAYWITIIMLFVGCKAWKQLILPTRIECKYVKDMLAYSVPLMPNSISWWINNSSDRYIMNAFRGLGELGLYSVSYKIPSIMATISAILISAWEMSAADDFGSEQSKRFFSKIYDLWVHAYIIVCTILVLFVKLLALFLFQKEFFAAWQFVPILLLAGVFSGLSAFLGTVFTSAKKTKSVFVTTMIGAGCNIIFNFLFIPYFGGYGAAIATLIGYLVIYFMRLKGANRIIQLDVAYINHFFRLCLLLLMVVLSCVDSWGNYLVGAVILIMEKDFITGIIQILRKKILQRKIEN